MSKHTPGPWSARDRDEQVFVPLRSVDCERIGFCVGFVNGHREKEAAANARLIAAAPEMFDALLVAEESVGDLKTLEIVRAAIAKATGEQA